MESVAALIVSYASSDGRIKPLADRRPNCTHPNLRDDHTTMTFRRSGSLVAAYLGSLTLLFGTMKIMQLSSLPQKTRSLNNEAI